MTRKFFFILGAFLLFGLLLNISWSNPDLQRLSSWHVKSDLSKLKQKNEYDAIIIGGGFGGLSCGSLLAKNGFKVLLIERNEAVGGLCSSYQKKGYQFSYGAEDIGGIGERGPITYLLSELGMNESTLFVPNSHTFFDGKNAVKVDQKRDGFENALVQVYPKEETSIRKFFAKAKEVFNEGYDAEMIKRWGIMVPPELAAEVMPPSWAKEYPKTHKNLLEWSEKTYQDVLDEYFTNPDLKIALCMFVPYLGTVPISTPASTVILHTFDYFFYGGYQAIGTPQKFAEELASYIKSHGGTILLDHHVDEILVNRGGVTGVQVGEKTFSAPIIVCNVNARNTYEEMIKPEALPSNFLEELRTLPLGNSAFALHLAVDNPLSSYTSILHDRYNHTYVNIPTINDPTLAPKGKSTVILRQTVRFTDFIRSTKEENEQYLKKMTDDLLARGIVLIPELSKGVVVERVLTPQTFHLVADVPYGVIYGFNISNPSDRLYFRGPIRGLYMANAFAQGAGVSTVISAGILCSHDILGWPQK